jgi:hypothetical protein
MSKQAIIHCVICGKKIEGDTSGYVLAGVHFRVEREHRPGRYYTERKVLLKEDKILFDMTPARKFTIHQGCMSKIIWEREHPNMALEEIYYRHLTLSTKGEKRVWRIDGEVVPDNVTKEELENFLGKIAKKLLVGEEK